MASAVELSRCPTCLKEYEERGLRTPHILPCHHTFCRCCLYFQLQPPYRMGAPRKTLQCKICQTGTHRAPNGVYSFQVNDYILAHLKTIERTEICSEHDGEKAKLYCKEDGCKRAICHLCVVDDHKTHNFVAISKDKEEKTAELLKVLEEAIPQLEDKRLKLDKALDCAKLKHLECLLEIETNKEEIIKRINEKFEKQTELENSHFEGTNENLLPKLNDVKKTLKTLGFYKETTKGNLMHTEICKRLNKAKESIESSLQNASAQNVFTYLEFQRSHETIHDATVLCNKVTFEAHSKFIDETDNTQEMEIQTCEAVVAEGSKLEDVVASNESLLDKASSGQLIVISPEDFNAINEEVVDGRFGAQDGFYAESLPPGAEVIGEIIVDGRSQDFIDNKSKFRSEEEIQINHDQKVPTKRRERQDTENHQNLEKRAKINVFVE